MSLQAASPAGVLPAAHSTADSYARLASSTRDLSGGSDGPGSISFFFSHARPRSYHARLFLTGGASSSAMTRSAARRALRNARIAPIRTEMEGWPAQTLTAVTALSSHVESTRNP